MRGPRLIYIFTHTACIISFLSLAMVTPALSEIPRNDQDKTRVNQKKGELSPALKRLNQQMHRSLRGATQSLGRTLGPLIIFEEGKMKLFKQNKEVAAFSIMPPLEYQQLKVFGHVFFVTAIQLYRDELSENDRLQWAKEMIIDINIAITELDSIGLTPELAKSQKRLLTETLVLIEEAQIARPNAARLKRYIKEGLPDVWLNADRSASLHLNVIDRQARRLIALLTEEERKLVRAHLYGGRGARRDNIVIQYFSWLFGEGTGQESDRIIFSENIQDHHKAMEMFAKYRMESDLARFIFNDSTRLDRDLLGDSTRALVKEFPDAAEVMKSIPVPR